MKVLCVRVCTVAYDANPEDDRQLTHREGDGIVVFDSGDR
jgi:hypothetical protein